MARIVIYNIAAEYGGALAILREYYEMAKKDLNNEYLIITGLVALESFQHVEVRSYPWVKKIYYSECNLKFFTQLEFLDFGKQKRL
jgi:hypothetical protein